MCFRDAAQRWQPAPGSKAAMLVKVNSIGRNQSLGPATAQQLLHLNPTDTSISPKPGYTVQLDRTGLLSKMAVPGDSKQGYNLKKGDANFCLVLPGSRSSSYTAHQCSGAGTPRPSSPQYGATPSAPIYDEPPPIDPPIYDEPPVEMEVEGAHRLHRVPYPTSHSLARGTQPPKLLHFPHSKHIGSSSASEYSPAGRECIKHMVNVDAAVSKHQPQTSNSVEGPSNTASPQIQPQSPVSAQIKKEVSLEKKQSWRLLEPRHSRQSSLASQEYPGPAIITYQDSGYSTGPSPSLRRKNRRRAALGTGSGRPGSVGSSGELNALNEKLMAEMKAVVNRSNALHGSKASLDTEMGSEASGRTARSPVSSLKMGAIGGESREDVTSSNRSLYRGGGNNHGDVVLSPLVIDGLGGRQKRTYEKVDSLEKSVTSQASLSSPEPPRSPSQVPTLFAAVHLLEFLRLELLLWSIKCSNLAYSLFYQVFPLFLFFNYPFHVSSHSMPPLCLIELECNRVLWVEKQSNASHPVVVETIDGEALGFLSLRGCECSILRRFTLSVCLCVCVVLRLRGLYKGQLLLYLWKKMCRNKGKMVR